ncbi:hypothetical protein ACFY4C_20980 [Actinomadura viridis]
MSTLPAPPPHSETWPNGEKPAEYPSDTNPRPGCRAAYDQQQKKKGGGRK